MKTPLLYVIREKIIEGRQRTWSQKGELLLDKGSFLPFRLLQHSSTPFRYIALRLVDSGTWRSQKIHEFLLRADEVLWSGVVSTRFARYGLRKIHEDARQFLELAFASNTDLVLDFEARFNHNKWPDWLFTYDVDPLRSFGLRIEQYVGRGAVLYKGTKVCYITSEGSITQP